MKLFGWLTTDELTKLRRERDELQNRIDLYRLSGRLGAVRDLASELRVVRAKIRLLEAQTPRENPTVSKAAAARAMEMHNSAAVHAELKDHDLAKALGHHEEAARLAKILGRPRYLAYHTKEADRLRKAL